MGAMNRRDFARTTLSAAAALAAARIGVAGENALGASPCCAFIKFLTGLDYDRLSDSIAAIGFDGVEVTVREEGGYIQPAEASKELPKFRRALDKNGLDLTIVTTEILSVDDPHADSVLRASADAGAQRYRLGFYRYDLKRPIVEQIQSLRPKLEKLATLNRQLSLPGMYQNHAGKGYFGATMWDLFYALRDISPEDLGCVYDLRHATVEAGEAWPMLHEVMKPHIIAYSVKDFAWDDDKSQHVPLGEGRVDGDFYAKLAKSGYNGPISLHVEYLHDGDVDAQLAALKRDLGTLQKWMGRR